MFRRCICALLLAALCGAANAVAETAERVVSLDYCADQYLLKLLPTSSIMAVSPDARSEFSYLQNDAGSVPSVRPLAENVLDLRPDLVLRSYGGGPRIAGFLEQTGIKVLQVPYANNLADIRNALIVVATGLGVPERGRDLVDEINQRLAALKTENTGRTALYMTPSGVTSGAGTLIHEMLQSAGLENFVQHPGWRPIPLERLAFDQPDVVAAAFFDETGVQPALWSPMQHPIAKQQLRSQTTVMLQGAWTSCGAWFLLDAIEELVDATSTDGPSK